MADEVLGQAWIDVSLRPKNIEKDAEKVTNAAGKKIEAFFDKYSKESFFDKYARKAEEGKLAVFLPSDKALQSAAQQKMGIVDRIMSSMGAKINKTGMMGAQLSYAAQDFVTGLSMGNLNQALMGASNNIGMMFQQISSAAGAWSTLALLAIPLSITAMKAFGGQERDNKEIVDALTAALDRQRNAFKLNAIARQALTDAEVKRMHGAANLQGRLEGEKRGLDDINALIRDQNILHDQAMKGMKQSIPAEDPLSKAIAAGRQQRAAGGAIEPPGTLSPAETGRVLRHLGLPDKPDQFEVSQGAKGEINVRRKLIGDDKKAFDEKVKGITDERDRLQKEADKTISNQKKLRQRYEQQVREEAEFQARRNAAGFNKYEIGKVEIDRAEREAIRKNEETGAGEIVTKPGMTMEEWFAKSMGINKQAQQDVDAIDKEQRDTRDKKMHHNRRLTQAEIDDFEDRRKEVERNRNKAQFALGEESKPGTLLDEMNKNTKSEFSRKRLEFAQQFAGGPVGFAGISDLYKQIQAGVGQTGNRTEQQIEAHTAASEKALADILTWMKTHPPQAPAWGN